MRILALPNRRCSQMLTSGSLLLEAIDCDPLIFLPHLRRAEKGIAVRIGRLAGGTTAYPPIDFRQSGRVVRRADGQDARPSQREALKTVLANRMVVITGGRALAKPSSHGLMDYRSRPGDGPNILFACSPGLG